MTRSGSASSSKDQSITPNRLQSLLLGIFGAVALMLSGIGIYGVISYSVAQRTHELGIRAALGASVGSLLRLVLSRGVVLTVLGLVIGLGGALGLTRLMANLLYGVGARDPATVISVAAVLAAVAMIACYVHGPSSDEDRPDRGPEIRMIHEAPPV